MFTGIIQGLGTLVEKRSAGGGMIFVLEADFDLVDPEEGESIAVNGACLTARDIHGRRFAVDVSPESLSRTGLGRLQTGSRVNLERALRLSDRLGGHMVSGHVDGVGRVLDVQDDARAPSGQHHADRAGVRGRGKVDHGRGELLLRHLTSPFVAVGHCAPVPG